MGKVLFGLSMSLDGFIADKNDGVSEVFAWMGNGTPIHLEHIRTLERPGATHLALRVIRQ